MNNTCPLCRFWYKTHTLNLWFVPFKDALQLSKLVSMSLCIMLALIVGSGFGSVVLFPAFHLCGTRFESHLRQEPCMCIGFTAPTWFSFPLCGFPPTSQTEHIFSFPIQSVIGFKKNKKSLWPLVSHKMESVPSCKSMTLEQLKWMTYKAESGWTKGLPF